MLGCWSHSAPYCSCPSRTTHSALPWVMGANALRVRPSTWCWMIVGPRNYAQELSTLLPLDLSLILTPPFPYSPIPLSVSQDYQFTRCCVDPESGETRPVTTPFPSPPAPLSDTDPNAVPRCRNCSKYYVLPDPPCHRCIDGIDVGVVDGI